MDLERLRTFPELNRTRHFGRTADALSLTQAAVSSRLKSLETQLGVTLFERSRREMRLTPEGSRLIGHAERLIAAWRTARQDVSLGEASEQLVIGESMTRVSHAKMALEYITSLGGSAYLPRRMVGGDVELGLLYNVVGALVFVRQAYATYPVRSPRLRRIERSLKLVRSD